MNAENSLFVGDPMSRCYAFATMSDAATPAQLADISRWIAERALAGEAETHILAGACEAMAQLGIGLRRATIGADTLHPVLLGRWFEWYRERDDVKQTDYGRVTAPESEEMWRRSPFYELFNTGQLRFRRRLTAAANAAPEFPMLVDLAVAGMTDYVAYCHRLGGITVVGEMDCIFSSWTSDDADGFSDDHLAALDRIVPCVANAIVGISLGRIADTLVETYLGRDAGRRVLRGSIERGVAEHIRAVLWYSDLKGFTRLVDSVAPELVIPMLNDYAEAVVSAIHDHGGQVLKLIGDGVLATFALDDAERACGRTLDCVMEAMRRVAAVNGKRGAQELPTTGCYVGLHIGDVFYGNVGSTDRLDFTVIGPAVNELTRIAGMSRTLDQDIVLSSAFAAAAGPGRDHLVSLGRYALRGVGRPQELFTLDRENYRSGKP
jgi:adenylate cyclase